MNTIDSQLAALNIAVDEIGPPIDLIGLCQGGWLSLLFAARFPSKTRRIVIVGAPIDVRAEVSALTEPVDQATDMVLDHLTRCDDGIVKGERMAPLWPREADEEARLFESLQLEPPFESDQAQAACAAFRRWDQCTVDLPGPYYREVVEWIYRENRLASGFFPALGREVVFRSLDRPLFLLVGAKDPIAPPAQAMAAAKLVAGPVETALAPCGHLALFMGASTLAHEWRDVANWLGNKDDQPK